MDIEKAKNEVNEMFQSLAPMVEEIVNKYSINIDKIILELTDSASLTNDEIRNKMLALSAEAYIFGMSKDASLLKQECAETLLKEAQAVVYNNTDGTVPVRTNASIIKTTDSQVVNLLYSAVGNLMKTKLDETHRMINILNSILISRNAEAKLNVASSVDVESRRQILNE